MPTETIRAKRKTIKNKKETAVCEFDLCDSDDRWIKNQNQNRSLQKRENKEKRTKKNDKFKFQRKIKLKYTDIANFNENDKKYPKNYGYDTM